MILVYIAVSDDAASRTRAESGAPDAKAGPPGDAPLGPYAAAILASEHWSLLAARSLIWNEAMSRATVFLTTLSASIIALALLADATGFGSQTTTLALVLLPLVFLLGLAAYARLVQINTEEFQLVLAMNRLRHAYVRIDPGLERYFTTGHHDDEQGVIATYMLDGPSRRWLAAHFLVNTPTIVATVDAALAAAIVALLLRVITRHRAQRWPPRSGRSSRSGPCCSAFNSMRSARFKVRRRGSPPRRTHREMRTRAAPPAEVRGAAASDDGTQGVFVTSAGVERGAKHVKLAQAVGARPPLVIGVLVLARPAPRTLRTGAWCPGSHDGASRTRCLDAHSDMTCGGGLSCRCAVIGRTGRR